MTHKKLKKFLKKVLKEKEGLTGLKYTLLRYTCEEDTITATYSVRGKRDKEDIVYEIVFTRESSMVAINVFSKSDSFEYSEMN